MRCAKLKKALADRRTIIFGVINTTPDSFSDGGLYNTKDAFLHKLCEFMKAGVDVVDIGGESTRPGSEKVSVELEIERVIPYVQWARSLSDDVIISVDTRKVLVAKNALTAGADIINDISGMQFEEDMADLVAFYDAWCVIMHMRGKPSNMQSLARYDNCLDEICNELKERVDNAISRGISPGKIFIDPGIGFAKKLEHNLLILRNLSYIKSKVYNLSILIGTSRKSFIGELLNVPPSERLMGTASSVACSVMCGADAVRVHDVAEIAQVLKIADAVRKS